MATREQIYTSRILLNTEQAKKEVETLEKKVDELRHKRDEAWKAGDTKGWKAIGKEIEKNEQKNQQIQGRMQSIDRTLNNMSAAGPKQLRDTIKEINRLLNDGSVERGSDQWKALQETLRQAKGELKKIQDESSASGSGMTSNFMDKLFPKGLTEKIGKIGIAFTGLKTMITTGIAAIQGAIDSARWFVDYNRQIEEATRLTREFLGLSGEALNQTRTEIQATAEVMGKDYKEVLSSVDTLMAQYQLTAQEAIDVVNDGFQSGADLNGTFLSQLQQYAPAFHDAGVSAKELVAMIQQTRSGIFSTDGMNVIQMGSKRIREMSEATQKAINGIGISASQMEKDLSSGTISTMDAIRQISEHLRKLPNDSQEVGAVLKDVFGRQGANAGLQLIEQLDTMETDLDKLKQTTGEYGELQREQIETQQQLNEKLNEMFGIGGNGFEEMLAKAKIFCAKGLVAIIDYCLDLYDKIGIIRAAVEIVRTAFDTAFKLIETGFWVIIDVVKATAGVVKGLGEMVEGLFTFDWEKIKSGWKDGMNGIVSSWEHFVNKGNDIGERWGHNIQEGINRVVDGRSAQETQGTMLGEVTVTGRRPRKVRKYKTDKEIEQDAKKREAEEKKREAEEKKREAEEKKRLKEAEDAAKAESDAKIAAKTHEYAMGRIAYREYIQDMAALQKEGLENRRDVYAKGSAEYEKLNRQVEELNFKGDQQVNQMKLEDLRRCMLLQQAEIEAQAAREEITEVEKQEQLRVLEESYLADKVELYKEGSKERMDAEWELEQAGQRNRREREQRFLQQLDQIKEQYLHISNKRQMEIELNALMELYDKKLLVEQDYQEARLAIEAKYAQNPAQVNKDKFNEKVSNGLAVAREKAGDANTSNPWTGDLTNYKNVNEQLRLLYEDDKLTHAEYLAAKGENLSEFLRSVTEKYGAVFEQVTAVYNGINNYAKACSDYEVAMVEKNYDKQIEAAGKNEKKRKKLEEQKQKEIAAIKSKANKRAMKIEIAQALASTAMAAINAYSSAAEVPLIGYILAPVAAAAATAAGLLQVATIKKQHQTEEAGYYEGGFTGGKRFWREAGVVHEGEFVANHRAVSNPAILPFLNFLDQAQRNNTVGSLTAEDVTRSLGAGGMSQVVAPVVNVQTDNEELRATLEQMLETQERLAVQLEQGIGVDVPIDGENGIYRRMKRYESLMKNK